MPGSSSIGTRVFAVAAALCGAALLLLVTQLAVEPASAAKTKLLSDTTTIAVADDSPRKVVLCPKKQAFRFPYGGTMFSTSPDADGEGIYPHSNERLGVQHGWHVTPVLYEPSPPITTARPVTLQVVCGPQPGKLTPPHTTTFVAPGQLKTVMSTCPGRRQLLGGGFQRTDFNGRGGDFATQSEMISSKTWSVSGAAFGGFGGELTSIGYCRRSKKPLLQEVTASTTIAPGQFGSATTPSCPGKKTLTFTGFNTFPQGSIFYAGGPINGNDSHTGSGYNRSLTPAILTVDGYCMNVQRRRAK